MSGFYDILSMRNPAVKELFRLRVGARRARQQQGLCLVRGRQLIHSLGEYFKFKEVYTCEPRTTFAGYNAERVVRVQKSVLQHVLFGPAREEHAAKLDDDDFVLGTIKPPEPVKELPPDSRCVLAVDGIKHPENMSLLLTSAVALKFDGVIFSNDCVDPFSYKVLEASQAVAWTMPHLYATSQELLELCQRHELTPCAASVDGLPLSELQSLGGKHGFCLAVGNEARGVSCELQKQCTQVALPMSELVDSLNAGVAGGIIMHSMACTWLRQI